MRIARILVMALGSLGAAGCIARPVERDSALPTSQQWQADLSPVTTNGVHGRVIVLATPTAGQSRVVFAISGGTPGMIMPWHIHRGRCGDNGAVVGRAADYPPLMLNDVGSLQAAVQLPISLEGRGPFYVHLHAPGTTMATLACGALLPQNVAVGQR